MHATNRRVQFFALFIGQRVMKTVNTVQENAEDIYAEAKSINEERAAAAEAKAIEDAKEEEAKAAAKAAEKEETATEEKTEE